MQSARAILIAGPTASGKSGLALALAERLGGVVINADSMQVYRELRILTARPTAEDEARVPHALYGFVSGAEAYSAGRYAVDAASAIARGARGGPRAHRRRRHRALLQGAAGGLVAGSACRSAGARLLARAGEQHGRRPSCTPCWLRETPRPPRV